VARRFDDPPHSLDWEAFRSARYFSINGTWYFQTREGFDEGPFEHREQLEDAVERYVDERRPDEWFGLDTG
jgi:hypothetical protein